ncbi:dienelactone hydrolase family protein [Thalassolituus sp. LLYu03]|uniref:dienelactone hydrolase family protein n=1 Tax=Thalassolituus sp. LLYu03 TaxID=3421656 RepID=UPI003D2B8917
MNNQWITISEENGQTFNGYLALPPAGRGPGLILIQEIWGVNEHIQAVAEQYAMAGFVVLAPDVYWRFGPKIALNYDTEGNAAAFDYLNRIDRDLAVQDVVTATTALKALPQVSGKVGVMGYCMGGQLAFRTAAATTVDAAVCYYGGGIANYLHEANHIHAPIAFHHGLQDHLIPQDARQAIEHHFAGRKNAVIYEYDADHGFNCWGRTAVYNQPAATIAQGRTLEFLGQFLSD